MKLKKLAAALTAAALFIVLAGAPAASAASAEYSNAPSDWSLAEVQSLYERGVVDRSLMNSYNAPITRAEFTAIAVSVYEYVNGFYTGSTQTGFKDTSSNTYKTQIDKAYNLGIINGTSEAAFSPDSGLTRQEAAKILCTVANVTGGVIVESSAQLSYGDVVVIDPWAVPFVRFATENGLMQGTGVNFEPKATLTREQAMAIMERMIQKYGWETILPRYRTLAVGVSDYKGTDNDGDRFKQSVDTFTRAMGKASAGGIRYQTKYAYNVTREGFFAAIESAFGDAKDDDVSIFLFSGHGVLSETGFGSRGTNEPTLVVSDGTVNEFITYSEVLEAFEHIKGTKIILVGSCYSGAILDYAGSYSSQYILTASRSDEMSYGFITNYGEYNEFEQAVSEGLGLYGVLRADLNGDGVVTFGELSQYVTGQVKKSHAQNFSGSGDIVLVDAISS